MCGKVSLPFALHETHVKLSYMAFVALLVIPQAFSVMATGTSQQALDALSLEKYKHLATTKDPSAISAGGYKLDPHHTSVTVKLAHDDLSYYTLRFDDVEGALSFDPHTATATSISVTINPNSVDTGDMDFNKKIASRYFEADQYPSITFNSASAKLSGDHFVIIGVLDFHGVKRPLKLDMTFNGFTTRYGDQTRMGFSGTATFNRSNFGVGEYAPLEADKVTLLIETEFEKS